MEKSVLLLAVYFVSSFARTDLDCSNGNCTSSAIIVPEDDPRPVESSFDLLNNPVELMPISFNVDDALKEFSEKKPGQVSNTDDDQKGVMIDIEIISFNGDSGDPSPVGQLDLRSPLSFLSAFMTDIGGILDLTGMNLTGVEIKRLLTRPHQGWPVKTLLLSNSHVNGLTADSLEPVKDTLQELSVDNCSVPVSALAKLNNLRVLNMSNNRLSTFEWLPELQDTLEVLDLSHNMFKEIRPELSVFRSLRQLDLSHNKIKYVEENPLALLPNLEILSLTMNELEKATFSNLKTLQLLELDWNYLRTIEHYCELPEHSLSLKLASNPWRCDCSLLYARDNNEILDLDILECANNVQYSICDSCKRYFLPIDDGIPVSNQTKESIEHLGCTGLEDQIYLMQKGFGRLRDEEPEKLVALSLTALGCLTLLVLTVLGCRDSCRRKRFDRKTWLKVQQIPALAVDKLKKPQEVPYIKIDSPPFTV